MRKFLILTAAILALSVATQAQTKVSGTVIDGNTKTIESATITLLRAKDSSVAKMSVADKSGNYAFEAVGQGKYLVSISAVGHQKGYSEMFEVAPGTPSITLKTIELIPQAGNMGAVTVT